MLNRSLNEGYTNYQLKLNAAFGMLVSIYVDPEYPDDFVPGFVRALNSRQVLLGAVSSYGRYDGFLAVRLSCILMVLSEDDLALRLKRIIEIDNESPPELVEVLPDEDFVHALCRAVQERGQVITLLTSNGDYAGQVAALDDIRVTLLAFDYFGEPDETISVRLRDVEMASLGAEEERMLQKLFDAWSSRKGESEL